MLTKAAIAALHKYDEFHPDSCHEAQLEIHAEYQPAAGGIIAVAVDNRPGRAILERNELA